MNTIQTAEMIQSKYLNHCVLALGLAGLVFSLSLRAVEFDATELSWDGYTAHVYTAANGNFNIYTLLTDNPLRDNFPSGSQIRIYENDISSYLRSGSSMFDALYALAVQEAKQNSVSEISDWAFDRYSCECFETGKKWNYVWTRDTSYSIDLALGHFDPERAANSLAFKLSESRGATKGEVIVQDTGTGGSWPVSSDRIVWALGAQQVLRYLSEDSRAIQLPRFYKALKATLATDRETIFDERDGLYRGEQSFLDWREQSYPTWTAERVAHIAMSKSLSTNVLHYASMIITSQLADELGETSAAKQLKLDADALKIAIQKGFWQEENKLFSALKVTELESRPVQKFDLLGLALAIIWEVATPEQAENILSHYPHTAAGAPVLWPEQPGTAIYHNRAIWPFVSAYWIKAAQKVGNAEVFSHNAMTLIRGAALNLSNMENFEFLTLKNWIDDGSLSGPVINSQRQLWSVAGYLSMLVDGFFGKEVSSQGIRFQPFVPEKLRNELGLKTSLQLKSFPYLGKKLNITLKFPEIIPESDSSSEVWVADKVFQNGLEVSRTAWFTQEALADGDSLDISLKKIDSPAQGIRTITVKNPYVLSLSESHQLWAPSEPRLSPLALQGEDVSLFFQGNGESGLAFNIYRNGDLVATNSNSGAWLDKGASKSRDTLCYTVEAMYTDSSLKSYFSEPQCFWPKGSIQEFYPDNPNLVLSPGTTTASDHGRLHFNDWGFDDQTLTIKNIQGETSGWYYVQTLYANAGPVNTGVTTSVKKINVIDEKTNKKIDQGTLVMPHTPDWETWADSTLVPVFLEKGKSYRIVISNLPNMSTLKHFEAYKGKGGEAGPVNRVNLAAVKLLFFKAATSRN